MRHPQSTLAYFLIFELSNEVVLTVCSSPYEANGCVTSSVPLRFSKPSTRRSEENPLNQQAEFVMTAVLSDECRQAALTSALMSSQERESAEE